MLKHIKNWIRSLIFMAFFIASAPMAIQAQEPASINLPAQALAESLRSLGAQADINVLVSPELVAGKKAPALNASLTVDQALTRLLAGTSLRYRFINERTVVLQQVDAQSSDSAVKQDVLQLARIEEDPAQKADAGKSPVETRNDSDLDRSDDIQEVVVTAQKREERLQDVPISISVLRGEDLSRSTDRGVAEAINRIPGVSTQINTTATRLGSSGGTVVIRGVPASAGVSPTAYYLDSIPFGYVDPGAPFNAPDPSGYDLERVEVLRGPQGTLYGASALNGVVRVLSKDANLSRFEASVRSSVSSTRHGDLNYRADAMINMPVVEDKVAIRGVIGYQNLDGWIDKSFQKNANDVEIQNYRLKLAIQPNERLSIDPMVAHYRADSGAPSNSVDGLVSVSGIAEPTESSYTIYGLEASYDFGGVTLVSSTSYLDFVNHSTFDYEPFAGPGIRSGSEFDSKVFSEEMRLDSQNEGPWRWSIGGFYRDAKDSQLLTRINTATGALVNPPYRAPAISEFSSESFAFFGELTHSFWDGQVELTGGLRYFEDRYQAREVSRQTCFTGVPGPTNCTTVANSVPLIETEEKFDKVTPRVVLAWHPTSELNLYASYSEGFRSGFQQSFSTQRTVPGIFPAEADTLTNYELGAKGRLFDRRLNFDAAVYYIDWTDVPVSRLVDVTSLVGATFLTTVVDNAGSANGLGVELGISAEIVSDLVIGANVAWNGLEIAKNVGTLTPNGTPAILFSKGERLPASAEYTMGFTADYSFAIGNGLTANVSGSANYISDVVTFRTDITNTNLVSGILLSQEGYWMSRASVGVSGDRWRSSVFVDNLGNESAFSPDRFSPRWNSWTRPRTIGLQVDYRFN